MYLLAVPAGFNPAVNPPHTFEYTSPSKPRSTSTLHWHPHAMRTTQDQAWLEPNHLSHHLAASFQGGFSLSQQPGFSRKSTRQAGSSGADGFPLEMQGQALILRLCRVGLCQAQAQAQGREQLPKMIPNPAQGREQLPRMISNPLPAPGPTIPLHHATACLPTPLPASGMDDRANPPPFLGSGSPRAQDPSHNWGDTW